MSVCDFDGFMIFVAIAKLGFVGVLPIFTPTNKDVRPVSLNPYPLQLLMKLFGGYKLS